MNTTTTHSKFAILPVRNGFSVHVAGCPAMGRKRHYAFVLPVAEVEEQVADAVERGHVVRYCSCTGRA